MIVIIESPYAGDVAENLLYLRACMSDAFSKGEDPICSHGLYTQPGVLNDTKPEERKKGIKAGFRIWEALEKSGQDVRRVFYLDRGWSGGMRDGLEHALQIGQRIEFRSLLPGQAGVVRKMSLDLVDVWARELGCASES